MVNAFTKNITAKSKTNANLIYKVVVVSKTLYNVIGDITRYMDV